MEFRIHAEKDHLYFHKNSASQTFTFASRKVVYFNPFKTEAAII